MTDIQYHDIYAYFKTDIYKAKRCFKATSERLGIPENVVVETLYTLINIEGLRKFISDTFRNGSGAFKIYDGDQKIDFHINPESKKIMSFAIFEEGGANIGIGKIVSSVLGLKKPAYIGQEASLSQILKIFDEAVKIEREEISYIVEEIKDDTLMFHPPYSYKNGVFGPDYS